MSLTKLLLFSGLFVSFLISCSNVEDEKYIVIFNELFQQAQSDFSNKDYPNSIAKFSSLIDEYPKHYWLRHLRAQAYNENGEVEKALEDFALVIEHDPENKIQALLQSGLIYQKKLNNPELAKWYYAEVIREESIPREQSEIDQYLSYSTIGSAYSHLGRMAFDASDYAEAIEHYTKALEYSDSEYTRYYLANSYFKAGNLEAAISAYNQSIQVVKRHFVKDFPASMINQCDTCGFPFGSEEYFLLAEYLSEDLKKEQWNTVDGLLSHIKENPKQFLDSAFATEDSTFITDQDTFYLIEKGRFSNKTGN